MIGCGNASTSRKTEAKIVLRITGRSARAKRGKHASPKLDRDRKKNKAVWKKHEGIHLEKLGGRSPESGERKWRAKSTTETLLAVGVRASGHRARGVNRMIRNNK